MIATAFEGFKRVWPEMPDRVAAEADNRMQVFDLLGALSVVRDWEMQVRGELTRRWLSAPVIPAGGMALTAERLAELIKHAPAPNDGDYNDGYVAALTDLRDALFPATELAEEVKPVSFYRAMTRKFATAHFGFPEVTGLFERTHTASDGGVWGYCGGEWELREYPPAPAEPAEEETKAEACAGIFQGDRVYRCALADGHYGDHTTAKGEHWQKRPASSPVVPAPTETGPWPTWEAVPEGVVYTSSRTPWHRWKNVKGERRHKMAAFSDSPWGMSRAHEQTMAERAPFVAVEEG